MKFLNVLLVFLMPTIAFAGSFLDWQMSSIDYKYKDKNVEIRTGFLAANPEVEFKGTILYYQGLADSMLNHDPLFQVLTEAGYRVVAFDYMGQGGSAGSMNNTTIENINEIGDKVVKKLGRGNGNYHIIGWSTGGLAAYRKAYHDKGNRILSVTLIAPGISPRVLVGEGLFNWPIDEISMRSLTSNEFNGVNDPHEDPIYPVSPLCVPKFALNLQATAYNSRSWVMDRKVKGFVLLSDSRIDTYVNSTVTRKVVKKNAMHFKTKTYLNTLHEIDNEKEYIAKTVRQDILDFIENAN